jgi:flagellar protein FlgJ
MNDPYASPGSRAVAQALVQRIISQETKDPMAQEKLRLEVEDMRKRSGRVEMETMTAPDGTVFEREKGRPGAQWQQSIKLPSKPEDRTSDQRELDQVNAERKAGGLQPLRLDEYKMQKARAGAASVNVNTGSKADEKFSEAFAKGDSEALQTIATAGMAARRNISRIDRLETLINQNPTGGLAALQQRAGEFGINTNGLDGIQAAQALINSLVPEQRQPGSGPMSDADLALFKQSLPRIINQPDGNRRIIDTMRGIAKYDAEGAAIVQQLRENKINRAQAFEMLQNRVNPLAEFSQPPVTTAPGTGPRIISVEPIR